MVSAPRASLARWDVTAAEMQRELSKVANIVLPLDGSAMSRAAVPVALCLAQLYNAVPHLVYVGPEPQEPKALLAFLSVNPHEMPATVIDHLRGAAAEAITQCARQLPRSLVVMCTGLGHGSDPHRFGSTAEAVLASSPERIVLVPPERGDEPWSVRRVLLAHDGTPASDLAAGRAAGLSLLAAAETIALHVAASKGSSPREPGCFPAPRYIDQLQHEWPTWTSEFMDRILALGAPPSAVHFDLVVTGGQPGSEIAEVARARGVDIVVMTWNGEWKSAKHMAPRVVIGSSGCPVLLVRSGTE